MSRAVDVVALARKAFAEYAKTGGASQDLQAVRRPLDATMSAEYTKKNLRRGEHFVLHE